MSEQSRLTPAVLLVNDFSIEEMLNALRIAATGEAFGLEALEVLAAGQEQPVFAAAVIDVRRQGAALGAAHALLMALSSHEATIAGLLRGEA